MHINLFEKLANEEKKFLTSQFLSPIAKMQSHRFAGDKNKKGPLVTVRIANVVFTLKIQDDFSGWGIFRPLTHKLAKFVRVPTIQEKQAYLKLFPVLRLILCRRNDDMWYGIPSSYDKRFVIKGLVPIQLVEEVQLFEVVQCRFDGKMIWFDQIDMQHNPRSAIYLRDSLVKLVEPSSLELPGLSLEERDAYLMAYGPALEADTESKKDKQEERIKLALGKAGATYQSYIERGNTYTVEYTVGNERHRSVVEKDTLSVQSAGICLSGGDTAFDLQSLVSVIKEGQRRRTIVRVGDNRYDEDDDY